MWNYGIVYCCLTTYVIHISLDYCKKKHRMIHLVGSLMELVDLFQLITLQREGKTK